MAAPRIFVVSEERENKLVNRLHSDFMSRGAEVTTNDFSLVPHYIIQNYDWLVLVRPGDTCPAYIQSMVSAALGAVSSPNAGNVRLNNILALDTGKSDPDAWPTIRTYDARSKEEYARSLDRMWKMLSASRQAVPPAQPIASTNARGAQGVQNADHTQARGRTSVSPTHRAATTPSPSRPPLLNQGLKGVALVIVTIVLVLLIIGGAVAFAYSKLPRPKTDLQIGQTATATIRNEYKTAIALQTANPVVTIAPTQSPQDLYASIMKKKPDIDDPLTDATADQAIQWDATSSCQFASGRYQVTNSLSGNFTKCMGQHQKFKNFAVQVTMSIQSGSAGGIIFRFDSTSQSFYRFSVSQDGSYVLLLCQPCNGNSAGAGTSAVHGDTNLQGQKPITLTVIASNAMLYLYVNGDLIHPGIPDEIMKEGEIGVYAASVGTDQTTVIFSNLKVWKLP